MDKREIAIAGAIAVGVYAGRKYLRPESRLAPTALGTSGVDVDPSAPVSYSDCYVAQRAKAIGEFGALGIVSGLPVPAATRAYKTVTLKWYIGEINRLCSLRGQTMFDTPVTLDFPGPEFISSLSVPDTVVNTNSANAILAAWRRHGVACAGLLAVDSLDGNARYWDSLARLAIAVNVDRAMPDYTGEIWSDILDNAAALPAAVVGVVGDAAEAVARAAGGIAWRLLGTPVVLAGVVGGAYLFRREIVALFKG